MHRLVDDIKTHIKSYLDDIDIRIIKSKNVFNRTMFYDSAIAGYLSIAKWIRINMENSGIALEHEDVILGATMNGHLDVVQWLYIDETQYKPRICEFAITYGHIHIVQWLFDIGQTMDNDIYYHAAQIGKVKIMQCALDNGHRWDGYVCVYAANWGKLKVLQWAYANKCEFNIDACKAEARRIYNMVLNHIQHDKQSLAKRRAIIDWLNQLT